MKRIIIRMAVLVLMVGLTLAMPAVALAPLSTALHVLPPLGDETGKMSVIDSTLTDFLTVTVCLKEREGCSFVREFTSRPDQKGLDYIKFQNHHYHVNWKIAKGDIGQEFEIHFAVAGLEIGFVHYTPASNRMMPIKFRIDNHPRIRVRVLHEQGYSAPEIAEVVRDEFGLGAQETAQILADDGFSAVQVGLALKDVFGLDAHATAQILKEVGFSVVEVGTALRDVFALDASGAARILKDVGYSAASVYEVLKNVFGLSLAAARQILENVGFSSDEIFEVVIGELAIKFAPQLRFDSGGQACSGPDTYPMSAQKYFAIKSQDPSQRLSNGDASTVTDHTLPVYWKAFQCGRQIRLVYWIFYGYQYTCDCVSGSHDADWENILVVLSEDTTRIAAVTYFQHSGQYTRIAGRSGFEAVSDTHPVVNISRTQHGNYHNTQSEFQTCCYWDDKRDADGPWMDSWLGPVVRMQPTAAGGEPWMDADKAGTFKWGEISTHPMNNDQGSCGQQTCAGTPTWGCHTSGCHRSQCEVGDRDDGITCWHCPSGYIDWGTFCVKDCDTYPFCPSVDISTYGLRYTISTSDAGLLYHVASAVAVAPSEELIYLPLIFKNSQ